MNRMIAGCLAAALFAACGAAHAASTSASLAPNAGWKSFYFDNTVNATQWLDNAIVNPVSFDFTLSAAAVLNVVEGGFGGTQFEVFANGQSLGLTSVPGANTGLNADLSADISAHGPNYGDNHFDTAFADADGFSKGSFLLKAGTYHVTGTFDSAAATAFGAGVGAVELVSAPVPEPETYALLLAGLGVIGAIARRRLN